MIRIHARTNAAAQLAQLGLVASTAVLFAAGCTGEVYAQPATPAPIYAEAYGTPPPPSPPQQTAVDVEYEAAPPVVDIETYPMVVFDGVPVYYVGGMWYRHDNRGWGYYRQEPGELSRQRQEHDRDPRWVDARTRRPAPPPRPGVAEPQAPPPRGRPELRRAPMAPPPPEPPRR